MLRTLFKEGTTGLLRLLLLTLSFSVVVPSVWAEDSGSSGQQSSEEGAQDGTKKDSSESEGRLSSYVLVESSGTGNVSSQSLTAAKMPLSVMKTPASVGIVTEELFRQQKAEVLGEALGNISGTVSHKGSGVFDFFVIRGFDSLSNGLVLVDGAPEPEATFYHLYNVERVEVLKGPGAALYGGNPLAASVNLVRKAPLFENFSRLGASYGSFGTRRGEIDINRGNSEEKVAFRLNAFGRSSEGYRDEKSNWQAAINPAVGFQLGQKSYLVASFEFVRNEYEPDSGIPLLGNQMPDVPRTQNYQSPFDDSDQNIYRTRIDFTTALNHSIEFRNKFYFTELDWKSDGTIFAGAWPTAEGSVDAYRTMLRLDDRQRLFGNQTEFRFNFSTGGIRHNLLTGFEWTRLGDVFTIDLAVLPTIDLYQPVETATLPLYNIPMLSQAADSRNLVVAPYLVDYIQLSDRVQLLAGGRFDDVDFKDALSGLNRSARRFSPMVGISYSATTDLSLYGSFGQSFAPPSSQVVGPREPEESQQFEVGAKKKILDGKAVLTTALFHLDKDNIAIPDATGFTRQLGHQRSKGIEMDLGGELAPGVTASASYAYTDAELTEFRELVDMSFGQAPPVVVDRSGNRPPFAPRHILGAWLMKDFGNRFSVGGGGRYLGRQFIAESNYFSVEPFVTLDALLAYKKQDWRVSFNLKNLTGEKYLTRGFGSTSVLPGDPFAIFLGIEFLQE